MNPIPKCPDDGSNMTTNLRTDSSFVEDEGWHKASAAYSDFLRRHKNMHIFSGDWGDCPKTQKSILKVEDTTQDTTIEKQEMVSENDFVVHSDIKVENEDRSKLVFGQPEGGFYERDII